MKAKLATLAAALALVAGCKMTSISYTTPGGAKVVGSDRTFFQNTSLRFNHQTNGTMILETQRTGPTGADIGEMIGTAIKTAK